MHIKPPTPPKKKNRRFRCQLVVYASLPDGETLHNDHLCLGIPEVGKMFMKYSTSTGPCPELTAEVCALLGSHLHYITLQSIGRVLGVGVLRCTTWSVSSRSNNNKKKKKKKNNNNNKKNNNHDHNHNLLGYHFPFAFCLYKDIPGLVLLRAASLP